MVEVSTAKRLITPLFPMYMRGYAMRTGKSIGVMDELYSRVLVMRIDGETYIWVTLDICRLEKEITDYMRLNMAAKYTVPIEHIIIATTHTHAGPDISFQDEGRERNRKKADYRSYMIDQVFAGIDECFDRGLLAARPYLVQGEIDGIYGKRNHREQKGDKQATMILFRTPNHVAAGIFHFSCHSTILGIHNMKISSDFLGGIGRELDEKYQTIFITMQGAAGDMGNRQFRKGNDEQELVRVKEELMAQIGQLALKETPIYLQAGKTKTAVYDIDRQYDLKLLQKQLDEYQIRLDSAESEDERKLLWSGIRKINEKIEQRSVKISLNSVFYNFGDLEIVTIPGELFSDFGMQLKESMAARVKLVWGYSNYSVGYLVTQAEFGKGYESMSTPLLKGDAETYVQHLRKLLPGGTP